MKQIEICKLRNGVIIEKETYFVENMDMFLKDTINTYVDSLKELNSIKGINNIAYAIKENDVYISDNYLLYKTIIEKTNKTKENIENHKENIENHKEFMKGLEKVMKK